MTTLPVLPVAATDCWNRIGIHGDHSCPELANVVHCHNCPVFAAAGRRFLDAPSPEGYLAEWTERLAAPVEEADHDLESVMVFRIGDEWLALPVHVLVEVTGLRAVHRVPYRGGMLAGLVNIRGELYLCVQLHPLLGIAAGGEGVAEERSSQTSKRERGTTALASGSVGHSLSFRPVELGEAGVRVHDRADGKRILGGQPRLLVIEREAERWVFAADEVDQVLRFPKHELGPVPATVGRAASHLTRGVFSSQGRAVGLLDDARLFSALRTRIR